MFIHGVGYAGDDKRTLALSRKTFGVAPQVVRAQVSKLSLAVRSRLWSPHGIVPVMKRFSLRLVVPISTCGCYAQMAAGVPSTFVTSNRRRGTQPSPRVLHQVARVLASCDKKTQFHRYRLRKLRPSVLFRHNTGIQNFLRSV